MGAVGGRRSEVGRPMLRGWSHLRGPRDDGERKLRTRRTTGAAGRRLEQARGTSGLENEAEGGFSGAGAAGTGPAFLSSLPGLVLFAVMFPTDKSVGYGREVPAGTGKALHRKGVLALLGRLV